MVNTTDYLTTDTDIVTDAGTDIATGTDTDTVTDVVTDTGTDIVTDIGTDIATSMGTDTNTVTDTVTGIIEGVDDFQGIQGEVNNAIDLFNSFSDLLNSDGEPKELNPNGPQGETPDNLHDIGAETGYAAAGLGGLGLVLGIFRTIQLDKSFKHKAKEQITEAYEKYDLRDMEHAYQNSDAKTVKHNYTKKMKQSWGVSTGFMGAAAGALLATALFPPSGILLFAVIGIGVVSGIVSGFVGAATAKAIASKRADRYIAKQLTEAEAKKKAPAQATTQAVTYNNPLAEEKSATHFQDKTAKQEAATAAAMIL